MASTFSYSIILACFYSYFDYLHYYFQYKDCTKISYNMSVKHRQMPDDCDLKKTIKHSFK